jgi:hypothetical protein
MLCDDAPEVIEDYPDDKPFSSCLIWGTTTDGRIGHVLFTYPPDCWVITAYFPAETEPHKWTDSNYRIRKQTGEE